MNTQTVKLELIEWLAKLSDKSLLSVLKKIKNSVSDTDWWDDLTQDQKKSIERGLKDYKNGKTISGKMFWIKHENSYKPSQNVFATKSPKPTKGIFLVKFSALEF